GARVGPRGSAISIRVVVAPAPSAVVANVRCARNAPSACEACGRRHGCGRSRVSRQTPSSTTGPAARTCFDFAFGETYSWQFRSQCVCDVASLRVTGRMPMRFDLVDLNLFRHVAEAGSITAGAERAHLALGAASTRIRHMEQALGAPLLVRGRHGVIPTQAGRTLLQHARGILRQAERLHEDLGAYAGGFAGQIRVLSNTNALTEFLPEALSSFLTAHPHVSVDLEERLSDEIVGLIAEGVGDIGIVAGTGMVEAGTLETYPFRRDRFVLVVARDHPLAKRSRIAFSQLLDYDF